jgi:hypothetical protein
MKRPLATLGLGLSLGLIACDADGITSARLGLAFETSISDASIGPGESATITYRLRNVSRVSRTVAVGCSLLPYVDRPDVPVAVARVHQLPGRRPAGRPVRPAPASGASATSAVVRAVPASSQTDTTVTYAPLASHRLTTSVAAG